MTSKFKVGDQVRFTKEMRMYMNCKNFKGTVLEVNGGLTGTLIKVKFKKSFGHTEELSMLEDEIEFIKGEK